MRENVPGDGCITYIQDVAGNKPYETTYILMYKEGKDVGKKPYVIIVSLW